jgi:2-polyprenyl-3-methyl-5-hydroxy-6-metoxy-1,4-benzoquinol methylase
MAGQDRLRWDAIYSEKRDQPFPPPDPLLLQFAPPADGARALDLAGGLGQNALWLAEQGYIVDLIDISRTALIRAQAEAARRGVRGINFIQMDLDHADLEAQTYDLIAVFRFLDRALFPTLRAAVKPGGRIIYQTYNTRYRPPQPFNPDHLLRVGELAGIFADWRILHLSEPDAVTQVVAIKPR